MDENWQKIHFLHQPIVLQIFVLLVVFHSVHEILHYDLTTWPIFGLKTLLKFLLLGFEPILIKLRRHFEDIHIDILILHWVFLGKRLVTLLIEVVLKLILP